MTALRGVRQQADSATGLDYFGARYLSGAQGRFTSPDWSAAPEPIPYASLEEPQSLNLYAYVRNNPLAHRDEDGHQEGAALTQDRDVRDLVAGRITKEEYMARIQARGVGGAAGLGAVAAAFGGPGLIAEGRALLTGLTAWALGHPEQVQDTAASLAEGVSNAPPGSLTSPFARLGATTAEGFERKLSQYLLNTEHAVGGPKAQWFEQALGFTKANMADLARQIVFDPKTAVQTGVTQYGTQYNQVINIVGANGKTIAVTFAWIRNTDNVVRLVTAVPTKQ
jgi:RHS repeat-associated protein